MKFNSVKSVWLQFTARCSRSDCYLLWELPKPGEEMFLATVPITYPGSLKSLFRPRGSRQMFWNRRLSGCGTSVVNWRSSLSESCVMLFVFRAHPEHPRQQPAAPRERAVQDPAAGCRQGASQSSGAVCAAASPALAERSHPSWDWGSD